MIKDNDDNIVEFNGRKYLKVGDEVIPIAESIEDLIEYFNEAQEKPKH